MAIPQACIERRFSDPDAVRQAHKLMRRRITRIVDIGPVRITAGAATLSVRLEVVPARQRRFPRFPGPRAWMNGMGWAWRAWVDREEIREAVVGLWDAVAGWLTRGRGARIRDHDVADLENPESFRTIFTCCQGSLRQM